MVKKRAGEKKGKKKVRKTKTSKKWTLYEIVDNKIKRKNKMCLKCGGGTFMGSHKNRISCGKCGYTEYIKIEKN